MSPLDRGRFDAKWSLVDGYCWQWSAAIDASGYGRFNLGGMKLAHRVSYEDSVGPIPEGLELDHLCRNRACVNPDHLEPVTRSTNLARSPLMGAARARMTHCKRGHDLVDGDVYRRTDGSRSCRACQREKQRASRQATPSVPCTKCGNSYRPWNLTKHEQVMHP